MNIFKAILFSEAEVYKAKTQCSASELTRNQSVVLFLETAYYLGEMRIYSSQRSIKSCIRKAIVVDDFTIFNCPSKVRFCLFLLMWCIQKWVHMETPASGLLTKYMYTLCAVAKSNKKQQLYSGGTHKQVKGKDWLNNEIGFTSSMEHRKPFC